MASYKTRLCGASTLEPITSTDDLKDDVFDAIVIGSGMGGLATATQLVAKGAKVLLLEKWVPPDEIDRAYWEYQWRLCHCHLIKILIRNLIPRPAAASR